MQLAAEHGDSVRVDSQIIISSPCLLACFWGKELGVGRPGGVWVWPVPPGGDLHI